MGLLSWLWGSKFTPADPMENQYSALAVSEDSEYILKTVCIGDGGIGKTTLLQRLDQGTEMRFNDYPNTTIGVDFTIKHFKHEGKAFKIQMWDTAGRERFHTTSRMFTRGAHVIYFCYDVANKHSFVDIERHIDNAVGFVEDGRPEPIYALVGLKTDLRQGHAPIRKEDQMVSTEEGRALAKKRGFEFYEVSSKTAEGTEFLLNDVVRKASDRFMDQSDVPVPHRRPIMTKSATKKR